MPKSQVKVSLGPQTWALGWQHLSHRALEHEGKAQKEGNAVYLYYPQIQTVLKPESPDTANLAGTATSHEEQQHWHSGGKSAAASTVITGTLGCPLGQGCSSPGWASSAFHTFHPTAATLTRDTHLEHHPPLHMDV